jgi:hypothetical protein
MDAARGLARATAGMGTCLGLGTRPGLAGGPGWPPVVAADETGSASSTYRHRARRIVERRRVDLRHIPDRHFDHRRSRTQSGAPAPRQRLVPIASARYPGEPDCYLVVLDCAAHPREFDRRVGVVGPRPTGTSTRRGVRGLTVCRRRRRILRQLRGVQVKRPISRARRVVARWAIVVCPDVSGRDRRVRRHGEAAEARGSVAVRLHGLSATDGLPHDQVIGMMGVTLAERRSRCEMPAMSGNWWRPNSVSGAELG